MAKGAVEIRTGTLLTRRACIDWYKPEEAVDGLTWMDRLQTLGFAEHLCLVDGDENVRLEPPFGAIPGPGPSMAEAAEWARRLVEEGHFAVSE